MLSTTNRNAPTEVLPLGAPKHLRPVPRTWRQRIGDGFCRLGGADLDILGETPDRPFFFRLGMVLLVPFTFAVVGVTAFLHIVTGRPAVDPTLVGAGLGWGTLLIVLERLLLTPRVELTDKERGLVQRIGRFLLLGFLFVLRIGLALATAVVVSEPVLTVLFDDEIQTAAEHEFRADIEHDVDWARQQATDDRATVDDDIADEQVSLQERITELEGRVEVDRGAEAEARTQCNDEFRGDNGGDPGFGPQATDLCTLADAAAVRVREGEDTITALTGQRNRLGTNRLAEIDAAEMAEVDRLRAQEFDLDDYGLWARIELTHDAVGWWWWLALSAGMVLVDVLPVLYKNLTGKRAHDEIVESRGREAAAMAKAAATWRQSQADLLANAKELHAIYHRANVDIANLVGDGRKDEARKAMDTRAQEIDLRLGARARQQEEGDDVGDPLWATPDRLYYEPTTARYVRQRSLTGPQVDPSRPGPGPDRKPRPDKSKDGEPQPPGQTGWEQIDVSGEYLRVAPESVAGGAGMVSFGQFMIPQGNQFDDRGVAVKRSLPSKENLLLAEIKNYGDLGECPVIPRFVRSQQESPPVLVIEWLPRQSLDRWLFGGGVVRVDVPVSLVLAYARNLLDNLRWLWEHGFAHGDAKLSNLLVCGDPGDDIGWDMALGAYRQPGWLLLADLGTLLPIGRRAVGVTKAYRPPEWTNDPVTWRVSEPADVYSGLGCTLWDIVTGVDPVPTGRPDAVRAMVDDALFHRDVPVPLARLIAQFMHPDPAQRVSDGNAVVLHPADLADAIGKDIDAAVRGCTDLGLLDHLIHRAGDHIRPHQGGH